MSNTSQSVGKQLELSPKETSAPAYRTDTLPLSHYGTASREHVLDFAERFRQAIRDYANRANRTDGSHG